MTQRKRTETCLAVLLLIAAFLLTAPSAFAARTLAQELEGENYLPIGLTPAEREMLDRIGITHRGTPPADAPIRNPGEFEPMTGVIVRYPFGNPTDLLCEYAEDATLWVIVANSSQEASASSTLSSAGCNMANVAFIYGDTDSIWTRDYGPWFIVDGHDVQGIVDHIYNRPRPNDDLIPGVIGTDWGIPVYGMDLEHTGGNYMSDGRGVAMSTRLVLDENTSLTEAEIDSIMNDYLGIETYHKLDYIMSGGIHHIDCWAKLLSPGKILVKEVDPGDASYTPLENAVAYLQSVSSSYGRPYEVVRIYAPNHEPYTNSLIVNDKVFVPTYGTSNDAGAITTYEAAMPGYDIFGFDGSWLTDDAIHCRAMGVTDRYMLYIDHVPLYDTASTDEDYRVGAAFTDMSGAGLKTDSLLVYWKTDTAPDFSVLSMAADSVGGGYHADIPAQSSGTTVSYYVFAADYSGRRETHPWVAPGDAHSFDIVVDGEAPEIAHTEIGDVATSMWPPEAEATVTDNLEVETVTLESWINGSPQSDVEMVRQGVGFSYAATFPGTASAGDAVTYRIRAEDAASPPNTAYSPETATYDFNVVDPIAVVVWEPDPSPLSGPAITALLDAEGVGYEYTTGTIPNLSEYGTAFICLGVYSANYSLSTGEADAIVDFLDAGGNVYMEGGDCWAYDSSRTIYNGHFGIDGTDDGDGDLSTVSGESGTFTEGTGFSYTGGNNYMDHIAPTGGATKIFTNPADNQGCGVANDVGGYATVGCAFEFGGLVDGTSPSTKAGLMSEILGFFGITSSDVPGGGLGRRFVLEQNRPNPFNPTPTIAFELPAAGAAELSVYNAAGRLVARLVGGELSAGRHTTTWNGRDGSGAPVASGVYFFRLTSEGESVTRKGVLLK